MICASCRVKSCLLPPPPPASAVAALRSGPDSQAFSPQLDETIALEGTFDLRQGAAHQGFQCTVVDVACSDQPQQLRPVANEPMLHEVIVLGDQDTCAPGGQQSCKPSGGGLGTDWKRLRQS